ncbi:MAG TPA: carbohydrate ABC transporter permease [Tissierellaceae bacterium]
MQTRNMSDKFISVISHVFIAIFAVICLLPFMLVVSGSITDEIAIIKNGFRLIPEKISFDAYKLVLNDNTIFNAYGVTIFVTVVGTILSMLVTSAMSYALSLEHLKYRNQISFYVYFTMLFSGGLVPSYLLITNYLRMKNSIWVLIIPSLVNPWNMFLLRNFFKTVPKELSESARIDGANDIYIWICIILPVSLPAVATVGLFYALGYWNEWFRAMLYIEKEELYPLQYLIMRVLRNVQFADQIAAQSGIRIENIIPSYGVRLATTVLTIGPIIFAYPFVQKYFVKGLMVGSIKG